MVRIANGINGVTGEYLLRPQTDEQITKAATLEAQDKDKQLMLDYVKNGKKPAYAMFDVDLTKLSEAGWAIVFHVDEDAAVKEAMQLLIDHRRKSIGNDRLVKELNYQDGETVSQWLIRNGADVAHVDPEILPFYILLIGSPSKIPFLFGHVLAAAYGVGRLYFTAACLYKRYVDSVISYETSSLVPNNRDVVFFGPRHEDDSPTLLSSTSLVSPMAVGSPRMQSVVQRIANGKSALKYRTRFFSPEQSTKESLAGVFCPGPTEVRHLFCSPRVTASVFHLAIFVRGPPKGLSFAKTFRAPALAASSQSIISRNPI
jgi:hypothetical protein